MRVSVVTACLNDRSTIEGTLKSILEQTYPDIEMIIVDGGSTDGTMEVVRGHAGRIARIISEKDNGIYDALNKGIRSATGEVVGFLHADDLYADRSAVEKITQLFRDRNVDGAYGDLVYVDPLDTRKVVRYWRSGSCSPQKLKRGWLPPHPTFYVRRSVFASHGTFDTRYRIAADYDLMLRLLLDKGIRVEYLPEVLVRMRLGGASNRSLANLLQKSREDYAILKEHAVPFPALVLLNKNFSKISQFFVRGAAARRSAHES
jgi:glycosyltransferase involved in cell wall biosynthesis